MCSATNLNSVSLELNDNDASELNYCKMPTTNSTKDLSHDRSTTTTTHPYESTEVLAPQHQQQQHALPQPSPPPGYQTQLSELLQNLLVSVQHAIERVPLDNVVLPCPQCLQFVSVSGTTNKSSSSSSACSGSGTANLKVGNGNTSSSSLSNGLCQSCRCDCAVDPSGEQGVLSTTTLKCYLPAAVPSTMFHDLRGSIPHIDSDDETDDHKGGGVPIPADRRRQASNPSESKAQKTIQKAQQDELPPTQMVRPKRITEIPEHILMAGITLPGIECADRCPIILCSLGEMNQANFLDKPEDELVKLLLYYSTVPTKESQERGFTVVLLPYIRANSDPPTDTFNATLAKLDSVLVKCRQAAGMKFTRILFKSRTRVNDKRSVFNYHLASGIQLFLLKDEASFTKYLGAKSATTTTTTTTSTTVTLNTDAGSNFHHDQLEWIEFYKMYESFTELCKSAGHSLLTTLSQLRSDQIPHQITRKFLNHQYRQISSALTAEPVSQLNRDALRILANLKERAQWLTHCADVQRCTQYACALHETIASVTWRLEQLRTERLDRLKELARLRSTQEEIDELISWSTKVGEETLNGLAVLLRSVNDATGAKKVANDFEKFFFNAWRQIERSHDLVEECREITTIIPRRTGGTNKSTGDTTVDDNSTTATSTPTSTTTPSLCNSAENTNRKYQADAGPVDCQNPKAVNRLKNSTVALQAQMKEFRERLEETRERIEDCSRCFLLLDSCHDILDDDSKEQEEFFKLAERSSNDKLLQMCRAAQKRQNSSGSDQTKQQQQQQQHSNNLAATAGATTKQLLSSSSSSASSSSSSGCYSSSPNASSTPKSTQIRRRSVSSLAYIYHCSHHAAGEQCNCHESDADTQNTVSYKLKKKYIQALQHPAAPLSSLLCNCSHHLPHQNCSNTDAGAGTRLLLADLDRKNSTALGGIKEERESVENLLDYDDNTIKQGKIGEGGAGGGGGTVEGGSQEGCGDSGVSSTIDSSRRKQNFSNSRKKMADFGLHHPQIGAGGAGGGGGHHHTPSCSFYRDSCTLCTGLITTTASSVASSSNHDAEVDSQRDSSIIDGYIKGDDLDLDFGNEERRQVGPVSANSHLYCHASTVDLPSDALYKNMDSKTQKTLSYIIREMIETERDYVKSLDYIIVNYLPELMREDIPQALRGQRNIIFGNVEKIYEFHNRHFLADLEECETNPLQIGQIFLKHDKRFYLYALYNKNKPKSDALMSEYGSAFFRSKQMELQDRMDLASYLLKPVQRMGKYALLLQQMMKVCCASSVFTNIDATNSSANGDGDASPIAQELEDLKQAEEMVRFKLRHGNDLLAMDSIRECDVNLKEQGSLLRQNEFLVWEGKCGKKSLRQVFLFEELILFSKARRLPDRKNLDLYIYKNSIKMTDIGLTARIGDSTTKFEIWFRKRKPNDTFTLQSMSEDVKKAWTEELSQLLWKQAIKNRAIRMAEMSSMGIGNKPCLDIRPSADQISDRSISVDQLIRTAPKFRNSIAGPAQSGADMCRNTKRPHSVISMSSLSSSSTSSGGSAGSHGGQSGSTSTTNSASGGSNYENPCSPKPYHRSTTLNSQCSIESGIIADISLGSDECSERVPIDL